MSEQVFAGRRRGGRCNPLSSVGSGAESKAGDYLYRALNVVVYVAQAVAPTLIFAVYGGTNTRKSPYSGHLQLTGAPSGSLLSACKYSDSGETGRAARETPSRLEKSSAFRLLSRATTHQNVLKVCCVVMWFIALSRVRLRVRHAYSRARCTWLLRRTA